MNRRDFLQRSARLASLGAIGPLASGCWRGPGSADESSLAHLLPTASAHRFLIKASSKEQLGSAEIHIAGRHVEGVRTDTKGYFWAFDVDGLEPGSRYTLELRSEGRHLTDPWQLSTLPPPDAEPERVRILAYTCAGGHPLFGLWLPLDIRRRLLRRGLAFEPDLVVANGDHIYWDLDVGRAGQMMGGSELAKQQIGEFRRDEPILGGENETMLKRVVGPQVAELYGTLFRSVPVFFLRDDHDYFENDYYLPTEDGFAQVTFPPRPFKLALARASQWLYYPEFLPAPDLPQSLPATGAADRPPGISEAFGTIRYGRLLEALCYDCKGFISMGSAEATLVPPGVERWLLDRMRSPHVQQLINIPSNPPGFTAGKWAEWYPDVLESPGKLTADRDKPGWQRGWLAQHDRILAAASTMKRVPLFLSGDIHSHAEALIRRSGHQNFGDNPVIALVAGTPGAGGWPSEFRETRAKPSLVLEVDETLPALEENGFNIVDVERHRITVRFFRWNAKTDDPRSIDSLEPFRTSVFERPA